MTHLCIILPAYNEGAIIAASARSVDRYLQTLGMSYELLIGDDGSTDDTAVAAAYAGVACARVVTREHAGKGAILSACILESHADYVGFLDSDLEIAVGCIGDLLHALQGGCDAAIASKNLNADEDRRPLKRRLITWGYNTAVRWLFGSPLSDHQAGAKMFHGDYIRSIVPGIASQGWLWDTEVLVTLLRDGKRVQQVPIRAELQRVSHVRGAQTALQVVNGLYHLWRQMRRRSS